MWVKLKTSERKMLERREQCGKRQNPRFWWIPINVSREYKNWGKDRGVLGWGESIVYSDGFQMMQREAEPPASPSAGFKDRSQTDLLQSWLSCRTSTNSGLRVIQATYFPATHPRGPLDETVEAGDIPWKCFRALKKKGKTFKVVLIGRRRGQKKVFNSCCDLLPMYEATWSAVMSQSGAS